MGKPQHAVRYAHLREKRAAFARHRIHEVQNRIHEIDEKLAEYAAILGSPLHIGDGPRLQLLQKIKLLQRNKDENLAELSHFDDITIAQTPPREDLFREFYDICSTPSVYSVSVGGVKLSIYIEARVVIDGQRYNLGDWTLALDLSRDKMKTTQLRSGLKGEVKAGGEHTSIQYSWSFGFCFGENRDLINELLNRGDYVAAIRTSIAYMNDVNDEHKPHAQFMYKRAS